MAQASSSGTERTQLRCEEVKLTRLFRKGEGMKGL